MEHKKEETLDLKKKIGVTQEVYNILREQKKKQGISMAKIVCNLIRDKYLSVDKTKKK